MTKANKTGKVIVLTILTTLFLTGCTCRTTRAVTADSKSHPEIIDTVKIQDVVIDSTESAESDK